MNTEKIDTFSLWQFPEKVIQEAAIFDATEIRLADVHHFKDDHAILWQIEGYYGDIYRKFVEFQGKIIMDNEPEYPKYQALFGN